MALISVIVCTHNPRADYLNRVLAALDAQTLPKTCWELLLVDNASHETLTGTFDLSWHERGRHVREDNLGLIAARLRGVSESCGELLVFVDDDNVLAPDFLEAALVIHRSYPYLGAFGAGRLEPEFEVQPPPDIRSYSRFLALRSVPFVRWSNNLEDWESIPWGAGLCITRAIAHGYQRLVASLGANVAAVVGPRGQQLFRGDDDLFSWVAVSLGRRFGIFPQLRVTHLIAASRLNRRYLLRLLHDHAISHNVLRYRLAGLRPRPIPWRRYAHVVLHGVKNGLFSMRCQWAMSSGEADAARFILETGLQPARALGSAVNLSGFWREHKSGDLAREVERRDGRSRRRTVRA